jgi:hypothetical protein
LGTWRLRMPLTNPANEWLLVDVDFHLAIWLRG